LLLIIIKHYFSDPIRRWYSQPKQSRQNSHRKYHQLPRDFHSHYRLARRRRFIPLVVTTIYVLENLQQSVLCSATQRQLDLPHARINIHNNL
jgi:hypothetical protein